MRKGLIAAAVVFGLAAAFGAGWLGGSFAAQQRAFDRQYERERALVAPALAADPAFRRVQLRRYTAGGIYLVGEVGTQADYDRLQAALTRLLGEGRAGQVSTGVWVERPAEPGVAPDRRPPKP